MKLGSHNWISWKQLLNDLLIGFGEPGMAILNGVPLNVSLLKITDCYPSTVMFKYDHEVDVQIPMIAANSVTGAPSTPARKIRSTSSKVSTIVQSIPVVTTELILDTLSAKGNQDHDYDVKAEEKIIAKWNHTSNSLILLLIDGLETASHASAKLEPTWTTLKLSE